MSWRYGLLGLPLAFVALPLYVSLPAHYVREHGLALARALTAPSRWPCILPVFSKAQALPWFRMPSGHSSIGVIPRGNRGLVGM